MVSADFAIVKQSDMPLKFKIFAQPQAQNFSFVNPGDFIFTKTRLAEIIIKIFRGRARAQIA